MKAIFNTRVIDTSKPLLNSSNRAFCYGDGLFETIVTGLDRIDLIGSHLGRMKRGCDVMGMELPSHLTEEYIRESIKTLKKENNLPNNTRTKILLWRNEGGLYSPESNEANYMIECKESLKPFFRSIDNAGVSEHYHTSFSPISFAKTMSALTYVMAGKEMKDKGLDEIILTDRNAHLAETHLSNLFWISEDTLFTPSLKTGCIEGIMRQALIAAAISVDIKTIEVLEPFSSLKQATSVFATNASGITWFKHIEGKKYENPERFLAPVIQLLQP